MILRECLHFECITSNRWHTMGIEHPAELTRRLAQKGKGVTPLRIHIGGQQFCTLLLAVRSDAFHTGAEVIEQIRRQILGRHSETSSCSGGAHRPQPWSDRVSQNPGQHLRWRLLVLGRRTHPPTSTAHLAGMSIVRLCPRLDPDSRE